MDEALRRRKIYENGKRDKLPDEFWTFYGKWLLAWKHMDTQAIVSLRDNLPPQTINQYSDWLYQIQRLLSKT